MDPQPAGLVSEITGFNLNIQIYMTCTPLNTMEMAYGIDEVFDWNRQKRVLENCLQAVKHALDGSPKELMLTPGSQPGEFKGENRRYIQPVQHFQGVSDGSGSAAGHDHMNLRQPGNNSRRFNGDANRKRPRQSLKKHRRTAHMRLRGTGAPQPQGHRNGFDKRCRNFHRVSV